MHGASLATTVCGFVCVRAQHTPHSIAAAQNADTHCFKAACGLLQVIRYASHRLVAGAIVASVLIKERHCREVQRSKYMTLLEARRRGVRQLL